MRQSSCSDWLRLRRDWRRSRRRSRPSRLRQSGKQSHPHPVCPVARKRKPMRDEQIETKAEIPSAVVDVSGRDVSILFSVDTLDRVGDITSPKAFNRSIGLGVHRVSHLFMHSGPAIGNILDIKTIGRRDLPADIQARHPDATGGAVAVSRMNEAGTGLDVLSGIRNGVPYGASFGFIAKKASPHPTIKRADGTPARLLEEVHLLEVTTALPGMGVNPDARTSLAKAQLLEFLTELKSGRRHSAMDQDWLNQIVALALSLGATLPAEPDQSADAPALTSDVDLLIADLGSLFEVT